ncbi:MarR family winged helix-turn-helix transcriptional regulator [Domibacillus mangrovi]|uniref:MarR family transcriptional regulator n=1 Tax=Domibacillus mangrovi TaxID=1714354 RepID=A0A1Q5P2M8_9BACI|nr:MarR family transcriptional regulator [Domibacillus mangrovi]OKL36504.1 MarR family transcriptional regulator [Domibacillus mangrovi]
MNARLKALVVLMRVSQSVQDVLRKDIKAYGLNTTEFAVLELLYHEGDQPIQHIGKKILLSSGSITYVVDKLEQKGLIVRQDCLKDRRVTYAVITHSGKKFIEEVFPAHEKTIDSIFEELSEEELKTVTCLLKKVGFHASEK